MNSKRLLSVANYVDKEDRLADVGCDHGYLSIYLVENNLCEYVIASDISANALSYAVNNIKESKYDIETCVSDGIKDLDISLFNTLAICGMGSSTIIKILKDGNLDNVNKLILQSNNDYEMLRNEVATLGYYLEDNDVVFENGKYYQIMKFVKSSLKNSDDELTYGIYKPKFKFYYEHLIEKYSEINLGIPDGSSKKEELIEKINYYKNK